MALISSQDVRRFDIPHEPGQWVELRPITARQAATIQREARAKEEGQWEITLRIINACLVNWSYEVSVSQDSIDSLDHETFDWIDKQIATLGRSADEKKESEPPSSLTSGQDTASSPQSSPISATSNGSESST